MSDSFPATCWINARVATFDDQVSADYGMLPGLQAITVAGTRIAAITPMASHHPTKDVAELDLQGMVVTPGLIDCHTHLVFAGDRSAEWEMRLQGKSYAEIACAGGGIHSTVEATRAASDEELYVLARRRLEAMAREGVTCVEIKSGYGLSLHDELKLLRVIRRLQSSQSVQISPTLLAAHTVPREFKQNPDEYVALVCDQLIPLVAQEGLAEAVDVFCEPIAFSLAQSIELFEAAQKHGLAMKAHAEQLSHTGCAREAAARGAWSVDHIEHLLIEEVATLASHGTVAVLLPGAFYALREKQLPPVAALREAGVRMAVATDCNPGTSPFLSLRLMMNMACLLFGLTPVEALVGTTSAAAHALGRADRIGSVRVGMEATLCAWDVAGPAAIVTDLSRNPLSRVMIQGVEQSV